MHFKDYLIAPQNQLQIKIPSVKKKNTYKTIYYFVFTFNTDHCNRGPHLFSQQHRFFPFPPGSFSLTVQTLSIMQINVPLIYIIIRQGPLGSFGTGASYFHENTAPCFPQLCSVFHLFLGDCTRLQKVWLCEMRPIGNQSKCRYCITLLP